MDDTQTMDAAAETQTISRTLVSLTDPHWGNAEHTIFMCTVEFEELAEMGPMPFDCSATDSYLWSVSIWNDAVSGVYDPIAEYEPPVINPGTVTLTAEQFYTVLDTLGKLEDFMSAIETVTPLSMKLTCRNQFNNSTTYTWDMVLMTLVAPKVWGATWQVVIGDDWVAASLL